ncbi:metalloregulator ArsR/SmtB family transcription factor [Aurantimonas sp. Leaf443]|uniref:ArsR/SmtB family transcription factor n=1 Tax=Aurantimonas sp. Leaf443 TaxID=1736378 RepID=UPI0006F3E536|nr:metalloregulator ArsR/SmtB family transcription factor [Aurantimonas sp. Leaf443]KQT88323.1 ArsR family transcriptional regulator [Aurantimonas sp. Leaf443]
MLDTPTLPFDRLVDALKAVGEPTRLRLVRLIARSDLSVSDLTTILGQSQPRVSRHLRLLTDCGILERYQEGAFAYFRLCEEPVVAGLVRTLSAHVDEQDPAIQRDRERLERVREERAARAADYFARNAAQWGRLRGLHAPEAEVEAALGEALGPRRVNALLDVGTGTGRILELLAPLCERAVGIDASREMLAVARSNLDAAGVANALVRQGDVYALPIQREAFDLVTLHQVLHYLDDPAAAVAEAARALSPGGRLAIVDFAPHALEFLRSEHAHLRLGFSDETVSGYLEDAGLELLSVRHLAPSGPGADRLTVTIWIAEDPRRLMAADKAATPSLVA